MAATVIECNCPDYTEYYETLIENQEQELETLETAAEDFKTELELLQVTTQMLEQEIYGLTTVINYQEMFFEMAVVLSVVVLAWKMVSKWFFGGV